MNKRASGHMPGNGSIFKILFTVRSPKLADNPLTQLKDRRSLRRAPECPMYMPCTDHAVSERVASDHLS